MRPIGQRFGKAKLASPIRFERTEQTRQAVGADVGAAAAMGIKGTETPHIRRIRHDLIKRVKRNAHREKDDRKANELRGFLPVEVVQDRKEQERINQDLDHLLPRDVLNFGSFVSDNGIKRERENRPTNRRPEKLRPFVEPQPRCPKNEDAEG